MLLFNVLYNTKFFMGWLCPVSHSCLTTHSQTFTEVVATFIENSVKQINKQQRKCECKCTETHKVKFPKVQQVCFERIPTPKQQAKEWSREVQEPKHGRWVISRPRVMRFQIGNQGTGVWIK